MSLFVKYVAVLGASFIFAAALSGRAESTPPPKAGSKDGGTMKAKDKGAQSQETPAPRKMEVPVIKGHPSKGLHIPYFTAEGKREMNFTIGEAARVDENHVNLMNMQIETFDEDGKHEMDIDLPNSVLDTDTSVITTRHHVTIARDDFKLTGEAMIFNTHTKQGGLGGKVHMIIYDLDSKTSETSAPSGGSTTPAPKKK